MTDRATTKHPRTAALELARVIARALEAQAFVSDPFPAGRAFAHVAISYNGRRFDVRVCDINADGG
jgi:hypothetical protein